MKIFLPVTPSGNASPTAKHPPLAERDGEFVEEFDAALARQKARHVPTSKAREGKTPHLPHRHGHEERSSSAPPRHIERAPESDARPLHRLREMVPSTVTNHADGASDDTSPQTDTPAIQAEPVHGPAPEPAQPASDENRIAAITEQLLTEQLFVGATSGVSSDRSTPDEPTSDPAPRVDVLPGPLPLLRDQAAGVAPTSVAVMRPALPGISASRQPAPEAPPREFRLAAQRSAIPTGEVQTATVDAGISEMIGDTPVTVREQQTHFSREPIGRSTVATQGDGDHDPIRPMDRERNELPRNIAQSKTISTSNEPIQPGLTQTKGAAEPPSDDSTSDPTPSAQLLGKLLDAVQEEKAAARATAPSGTWLPAERPFGALIRQIRLELSPASLGVVHITLKGVNAALKISIEAERPQTAASLQADCSVLSSSLAEAGYRIDDLVVTTLDRAQDVTPSPRSDQTMGSSNGQLATASNSSEQRQADDGWRRARPERDQSAQGDAQEAAQPNPTSGADHQNALRAAWRGRHVIRSI